MDKEIINQLMDYKKIADQNNLNVDVMRMYQAFYHQHKNEHGSYASVKEGYHQKMVERYQWIFDQIQDTIESKIKYGV